MRDSKNNFAPPKHGLNRAALRLFFLALLLIAGPVLAQQTETSADSDAIIYNSNQLADTAPEKTAAGDASLAENQPLELIKLLDNDQPENDLSLQQSDTGAGTPSAVLPQTAVRAALAETQPAAASPLSGNPPASVQTAPLQPAVSPTSRAPRIGRRPLSDIGLVSLGLPDARNLADPISSLIWRGSEAARIVQLYQLAPHDGPSDSVNALVRGLVLRQAVPPSGAAEASQELISARLGWLAEAGESTALADLIRKLPEDEIWLDWQRWLVSYELLLRQDNQACDMVSRQIQSTMEDYWHKAQILCHLLAGNNGAASFAADVLRASGSEDMVFFRLTDQLLGRPAMLPDRADISGPLHLALTEAAHFPASRQQLASLPNSYSEARAALTWLDREAALDQAAHRIRFGQMPANEAGGLLRSLYDPAVSIVMAISQLEAAAPEAVDGASAGILAQLAGSLLEGTASAEFDLFVRTVFAAQMQAGSVSDWLPLYSWLVDQRLAAEGLPELDKPARDLYAMIKVLVAAEEPLMAQLDATGSVADYSQTILAQPPGAVWPVTVLDGLAGWHLAPLLSALGQQRPQIDWFDTAAGQNGKARAEQPVPEPKMLAVKQVAETGRVGETALLVAWLLADQDLAAMESRQLAELMQLLDRVGLENAARKLGRQALQEKLLALFWESQQGI